MKTRPSMTTSGHFNGTQSWRTWQNTFMEQRGWKKNLLRKLWVMGTVLKVDVFYSIHSFIHSLILLLFVYEAAKALIHSSDVWGILIKSNLVQIWHISLRHHKQPTVQVQKLKYFWYGKNWLRNVKKTGKIRFFSMWGILKSFFQNKTLDTCLVAPNTTQTRIRLKKKSLVAEWDRLSDYSSKS